MLQIWVNLIPLCVSGIAWAHDAGLQQDTLQSDLTFDTNSQIGLSEEPWTSKYGAQNDLGYSGPLSFSHFNYKKCLEDASVPFDIGIIGFPFDTTTSFRPGKSSSAYLSMYAQYRNFRGTFWTIRDTFGIAKTVSWCRKRLHAGLGK